MLLIEHYVAQSPIHGLGVFSAVFASKGEKIWSFHPSIDRIVSVAAFEGMPRHVIGLIESRADYLEEQDAFLTSLDGHQFMNHSNAPNTVQVGDELYASADIFPDDELTCDYRETLILAFNPETGKPHPRRLGE